jgi:hypothetical protein
VSDFAFHFAEEPGAWPMAVWWPVAAGLAAGIFCTAIVCPAVPSRPIAIVELWGLASRCTIPVFLTTALAVRLACHMMGSEAAREGWETVSGVACAATWFPPLVLFLRQNSPWAAVLAVTLAVVSTRAVLARLDSAAEPQPGRFRAVAAAVALQSAAVEGCIGNWRGVALGLVIAALPLTWLITDSVWPPRRAPKRRRLRIVPMFLLGMVFAAGGMTPYLERGDARGGLTGLLKALFSRSPGSAETPPPDVLANPARPSGWSEPLNVDIDQFYPAVILWPEVEPYVTMVPPLMASPGALFSGRRKDSLGVPFSGFYTFQRATVRPPPRWFTTHGSPADITFRTTDMSPLVMEAHQDFSRSIEMRCCSEIRLALRIADAAPETVKVELVLSDRRAPGRPSQSLGVARLEEIMTFPMPAESPLREFDHATIEFRLGRVRVERSARIAIRRFHFIP